MRFFGLAVSVYLIDNGYYIPSPVSALPTSAIVAADYIIIAVKTDNSMEHIFTAHAIEHNIIFLRRGSRAYKAHRVPALLEKREHTGTVRFDNYTIHNSKEHFIWRQTILVHIIPQQNRRNG